MFSRVLVFVGTAFLLSGCFASTSSYDKPSGETANNSRNVLVVGVVDANDESNTDVLCPAGVQSVRTVNGFVDSLLTVVTFSLYSPNHVEVTCLSGVDGFYLNDDEQIRAVSDVKETAADAKQSTVIARDVL